eukprot:TRINITY_DN1105_c0_g1_i1.p1 TRINITY_DN1105_c0_g1~~TRINITY_DN1105_c0_g1_i1.p1  ORF type:complete len:352 (-),score=84.63 TRINITY_DN1105_c0_g1_i1:210-1265(-)
MKELLLAVFAVILVSVHSLHPSGYVTVNGKNVYLSGVNLPWINGAYGHDLGPNPLQPNATLYYNGSMVGAIFRDIKRVGWNAVRFYLCEGGEGILLDENQYVTGLHPTFLKNLDDFVARAQQVDLLLYLTFSDSFIDPETRSYKFRSPIIDPIQQDNYLRNVINPIAARYKGNKNILAFEVIDEIERDVAGLEGNYETFGAEWDQARNFISRCVNAIKIGDQTRLVSSSSGLHSFENILGGKFTGIGLDFYDYHSFSATADVDLQSVKDIDVDRPLILGEFGSSASTVDNVVQNATDITYYNQNALLGYAGGFVWNYGFPQDVSDVNNMFNSDGTKRPVVDSIKTWISSLN